MISFSEDPRESILVRFTHLRGRKSQFSNWTVEVGVVFQNPDQAQLLNRKVGQS